MKVPHSEGVANHTDPLSCVGHSGGIRQSVAGESIQPLSREICFNRSDGGARYREVRSNPGWSETLQDGENFTIEAHNEGYISSRSLTYHRPYRK